MNDFRRNIDITSKWIYFTSSNFLHNAPWLQSFNFSLVNNFLL